MNRKGENKKLIDEMMEEMNKLDLEALEEKIAKLLKGEKEFSSKNVE